MSKANEAQYIDKKDVSDHETVDHPLFSTNSGQKLKSPVEKSLNLMKPSLSLTSLPPPQSPKEPSNEDSNERPYNSLKKKRDGNDQRELWRRSWESQNSISTTTSHTGTSTGKNEFWTTYNYLMNNSIIDSCREANGETKFAKDVTGDVNFKNPNQLNLNFQQLPGSQGSSLVSDPRRLRRWLRDMENRISKLPSLKEAMKLSANELTKYSTESSDYYREINSNSRFVAACIRSLEENLSTKTVEDQPKSLECSEYESLVSTITATSTESKRSENALKPNALERRYHLLYLRCFEIQCMYESLLEKRNFLLLNKEFENNSAETSDEEPIPKIPKFSQNSKFVSYKNEKQIDENAPKADRNSQLKAGLELCDADNEDFGTEKEMEKVDLKDDCIDHTVIVSVKKSASKTPSPVKEKPSPAKTSPIVVRRLKDFSKFNRSNRKSKNCAIFYYKHIDTDIDQIKGDENNDSEPSVSSSGDEEVWEYSGPMDHERKTLAHDEDCVDAIEKLNDENCPVKHNKTVDDKSKYPQQPPCQIINDESNNAKLITKEKWHELALEAESIVLQNMSDKTAKTEYFFNEIVGARNLHFGQKKSMSSTDKKDLTKFSRVQEWLKRNHVLDENIASSNQTQMEDNDGDASAECTEDTNSTSSEEITDSVATCLQGVDPMLTSTEGLENSSPIHKVAMRAKTTHRRNSARPWSVSCLSQLTRNFRQSLTDDKTVESTTATLSNFSISESALNQLPDQYKSTSETKNNRASIKVDNLIPNSSSVGSKNSSLRRRRVKLRKKSLSSNKRSDSISSVKDNQVCAILKSMTKPDVLKTSLIEDLSVALSMINFGKENNSFDQGEKVVTGQRQESGDEQTIKRPNFKIGSITNVYGNPNAMSLGSLATLANYNSAENRENNENLSSFSEHNMWDNYIGEKYNSEAYSEDRDIDAARKLLDCDDYRNFIDSQSDCCSSLNSAVNQQMDSLSPPRLRKIIDPNFLPSHSSSNENSLNVSQQQRRAREDRKSNILLESLLRKNTDHDADFQKQTEAYTKHKNNEHELAYDENKFIADCKLALEHTQALRQTAANSQLLRPEDYDEIVRTCSKNIEQLEKIISDGCKNPTQIADLIASWNNLLNWSENAAKARRLQEEIILQQKLLDSIDIDNEWALNSEEAIREKIDELMNTREELFKHRSNMLKLNAAVHSWLTRQELELSRSQIDENCDQTTQSDMSAFADDELHKYLKEEIVLLYAKWDHINGTLTTRLSSLKDSLVCWTKFEKGLEELQENLSKDRGALNGLKGAIEEGTTTAEELVDNVQQVSKLLSEKLESRIQTISSNEDFMMHPEAALKFITSSNGSYQSDSGNSDEGFSELSERERRLIALKKIAKQLENALSPLKSPSSDVLNTITQRMEAAENELKVLQNTCRELIMRQVSSQLLKQQGIDISTHAQSQINVQIPIITIKNKTKRSLPRRGKKRASPISNRKSADHKLQQASNSSDSDMEESRTSKWSFFKRVAKYAVPIQLTIITLFCVACLLEPRCCDAFNNLSMSFTPQLRYKGPPPT